MPRGRCRRHGSPPGFCAKTREPGARGTHPAESVTISRDDRATGHPVNADRGVGLARGRIRRSRDLPARRYFVLQISEQTSKLKEASIGHPTLKKSAEGGTTFGSGQELVRQSTQAKSQDNVWARPNEERQTNERRRQSRRIVQRRRRASPFQKKERPHSYGSAGASSRSEGRHLGSTLYGDFSRSRHKVGLGFRDSLSAA